MITAACRRHAGFRDDSSTCPPPPWGISPLVTVSVFRFVKHQQPLVVLRQPLPRAFEIGGRIERSAAIPFRYSKRSRKGSQVRRREFTPGGPHPPLTLIVRRCAIAVLHENGRLSDAAGSGQRRDRGLQTAFRQLSRSDDNRSSRP